MPYRGSASYPLMLSIEWESAVEESDVIAGSLGNGRVLSIIIFVEARDSADNRSEVSPLPVVWGAFELRSVKSLLLLLMTVLFNKLALSLEQKLNGLAPHINLPWAGPGYVCLPHCMFKHFCLCVIGVCVCTCVLVCVCVLCVCLFLPVCVCLCARVCVRMCECMCMCARARTRACTCVCFRLSRSLCLCAPQSSHPPDARLPCRISLLLSPPVRFQSPAFSGSQQRTCH